MAKNNSNLIISERRNGKKIVNNHYIVVERYKNKQMSLKPTFIRALGSSGFAIVCGRGKT